MRPTWLVHYKYKKMKVRLQFWYWPWRTKWFDAKKDKEIIRERSFCRRHSSVAVAVKLNEEYAIKGSSEYVMCFLFNSWMTRRSRLPSCFCRIPLSDLTKVCACISKTLRRYSLFRGIQWGPFTRSNCWQAKMLQVWGINI